MLRSREQYLGMKPGDLEGKPYARYWNPRMAPPQEQVRQALLHGIEAAELGFPLEEANRLLEPGYLPLENGYTRLDNGQLFVANRPASHPVNRIIGNRLVSRLAARDEMGRDMVVHCAMEMNQLASFLPSLYRDYHPPEPL